MSVKQVLFLTGPIASGKTYFANHHARSHTYLSVSSIVKGIISSNKRSELQQTSDLDEQISNETIRFITQALITSDRVLIDGIRQLSIIVSVLKYFKTSIAIGDIKFKLVWLTVPQNILEERYNKQTDKKNDISFKQAIEKDYKLGLKKIENVILNFNMKYSSSIIHCHGLEPWCDVYELKGDYNE